MVKRIYILRHGETQWNKEDVFRGRSDIPLNETGLKQAEMASFYFKNKEIDFIFSSPLLRAVQTAKAVSKTTEKDVEIVEEFIDINFGIWEGLTVKEVERNYPHDFAIWVKNPQKLNLRGGETLETVRKRIASGFEKVLSEKGENLLIVTHRAICKIMVLFLLDMGNEFFWAMKFDPASITLIEKINDRFTLTFSNDTCHLQSTKGLYKDF
ncbi:MAG TPA: histidine phosphatase family protein [Syntrophorhabdaceae bacterium]|mgnify:CR=1 FL=1|nr:histidine phosphatase family protein [Syntrophorhabdaceae bacterium]